MQYDPRTYLLKFVLHQSAFFQLCHGQCQREQCSYLNPEASLCPISFPSILAVEKETASMRPLMPLPSAALV